MGGFQLLYCVPHFIVQLPMLQLVLGKRKIDRFGNFLFIPEMNVHKDIQQHESFRQGVTIPGYDCLLQSVDYDYQIFVI